MSNFFDEILKAEKALTTQVGDFNLFVVVQIPELYDRWDLVASSRENRDSKLILDEISKYLQSNLSKESIVKINRIVVLDPNDLFVQDINLQYKDIYHSDIEISNRTFNDLFIERAHLITSGSTEQKKTIYPEQY